MKSTFAEDSSEWFKAVVDYSLTPIYTAQAVRDETLGELVDFQINYSNPALRQRVRLSEEDLRTKKLRVLFPTLVHTGYFDCYRQVVETGEPFEGEQEYPGPNGHFWYQTSVRKLNDGIVVNFIDITDKKLASQRAEEALRLTKGVMDASISSILSMTAIRDKEGNIVDFMMDKANRAVERSLFRGPEALEGHTLLEIFPGNIDSGFFDLYAKAANTGESQQATYHYTDVNGFAGWFEVSAVQQERDKIVLTFMNVTDYKQNELLVRQQADLFNSVLNATLAAVATYQPVYDHSNGAAKGQIVDFHCTLANQAMFDMVGMPPDVLYTKTLCDLNPALRGTEAFKRYVSVIETGKPMTQERQIWNRWFLISAVRFDSDRLLTSSIDITETKQAREQLAQLNEQLKRSNASLDQFASVASHDLQEPLRKIQSFGDLLLAQHGPALGDGVNMLKRMQSAATRMQTLIRDLLLYARLTKDGRLSDDDKSHQPVDLSRIVEEVLIDLEMIIEEKKAVLEVGELPTLPGDALQLRQVFQNLLSNALKFSRPSHPPRISVTSGRLKRSELSADVLPLLTETEPLTYWQITLTDNGIGFGETYREKIFGPFERLHGKNSVYSGSGIGLTIVRRVMDNHRGAVNAHSTEGAGATFTLYFPYMI